MHAVPFCIATVPSLTLPYTRIPTSRIKIQVLRPLNIIASDTVSALPKSQISTMTRNVMAIWLSLLLAVHGGYLPLGHLVCHFAHTVLVQQLVGSKSIVSVV